MRTITLEELLEAGSHFGHQVTRHNPKSRDYVFEARDNIHIIDLAKTKEGLEEAANFVKSIAEKGGSIIILGAKRQADMIVKEEVKRVQDAGIGDLYYVTARWIGGLLTNLPEVSKNFQKLQDLTKKLNDPYEKAKFTKKEVSMWDKEKLKLENFYLGVANMKKVPDAVFIIDTHLEDLAVKEARAMKVPIVGITDTNADPTIIDYPIPANDDAAGSIKLITNYLIDAWIEGKQKLAKNQEQAAKGEEKDAEKSKAQSAKSGENETKTVEKVEVKKAENEVKAEAKGEEKVNKEKKPSEKKVKTQKAKSKTTKKSANGK